jgi:type II secretory pathway pseudopilin PulG
MTLVEVVLGLVLLATLLVAVLLTRARFVRQTASAQRRAAAVVAADELLSEWWGDRKKFPVDAEGAVKDRPELAWRTRLVADETAQSLGGRVVALEMLDRGIGDEAPEPILRVELLLPGEARP